MSPVYAGDRVAELDLAQRSAGKIRQRLGGSPDWEPSFLPKPKGTWQRAYERMPRRYVEVEALVDDAVAQRDPRLLPARMISMAGGTRETVNPTDQV